jgi:hypothetical protein
MASRWTPYEIEQIKRACPEFKGLQEKPSIDSIVVEFLERYEVYVKPASSAQGRSAGDRLSDGMVGGLAGPAAVAANQGLRGQQQNTAVQEWTQWKQWALDHKNFEAFRAEKLDDREKLNARLESDEFAEEWSIKKDIFTEKYELQRKTLRNDYIIAGAVVFVTFIGLLVLLGISHEQNKKNRNLRSSQILQPIELASQLT